MIRPAGDRCLEPPVCYGHPYHVIPTIGEIPVSAYADPSGSPLGSVALQSLPAFPRNTTVSVLHDPPATCRRTARGPRSLKAKAQPRPRRPIIDPPTLALTLVLTLSALCRRHSLDRRACRSQPPPPPPPPPPPSAPAPCASLSLPVHVRFRYPVHMMICKRKHAMRLPWYALSAVAVGDHDAPHWFSAPRCFWFLCAGNQPFYYQHPPISPASATGLCSRWSIKRIAMVS